MIHNTSTVLRSGTYILMQFNVTSMVMDKIKTPTKGVEIYLKKHIILLIKYDCKYISKRKGGDIMATYMITYDLNSQGQKYEELINAIKSNSLAWCSYWKSSYLVKTTLTLNQFQEKLNPHLDGNDRLIMIDVKPNYQGWLEQKDWEWISKNIFS